MAAPTEAKDDAPKAEPVMTSAFWFEEETLPTLRQKSSLKRVMFDSKSEFQTAQIIETGPFGKTLVLDGKTQSALFDEHVYHESLVLPAMMAHPNPKRVYIGGGGELATAREVLRFKSVEKCVMVDIDEVVVNICREHMPEWGAGVTEDPRLQLEYDDANGWLRRYDGPKFDVIIMDIADPIEAGPGIVLYTKDFYEFAITMLNPGGILVTQSGPGSVLNATECFACINKTLGSVFDNVVPYTSDIPSFASNWGFNMAFNKDAQLAVDAAAAGKSPSDFLMERPAAEFDAATKERLTGENRFMDGITLRGVLGVPLPVRKVIEAETRIMTVDNPVFMY